MADNYANLTILERFLTKIKAYIETKLPPQATETTTGTVKLNPDESVTLNSDGQLDVGGRLGQMSNTTGVYSPKSIKPAAVGNGSFLLTEASGTKLGNKSLAVSTGTSLNLKTTATAGTRQYVVSNTYENRIICAGLVGGVVCLNEATAADNYVNITSVRINGASITPDSSPDDYSNNIIITTDASINPSSSVAQIRVYANEGNGFSNLFVGQQVGGNGGASVIVGQKVFAAGGNACALVGASIYNTGNGNAVFGRQHISRKNRGLLAGTGHDTTNAKSESVAALGQWSDIASDTLFAIGNGTSPTNRSNAFEITDTEVKLHGKVAIKDDNSNTGVYSDLDDKWLTYADPNGDVYAGAVNVTSVAAAQAALGVDGIAGLSYTVVKQW